MINKPKPYFSYDQIRLIPEYFAGTNRNGDTSVKLGKHTFKLPIIPANMACCIDNDIAARLSDGGYFYIMHRFGNTLDFIKNANLINLDCISISVGVKPKDYELINKLVVTSSTMHVDFITVDIAHGHSLLGIEMIKHIRNKLPNVFIIAGNVCTRRGVTDLAYAGADAVKVGIAQGGACTTHGKTGFGLPMFTCVQDATIDNYVSPIPVIADGGIRTNGDITKALVAGGTMVMAGSIFAALKNSPAKLIEIGTKTIIHELGWHDDHTNTKYFKEYYGSASADNGNTKHIEGTKILLPLDDRTYLQKMEEIDQDLRSAISYAGGRDLTAFKTVEYGYAL
jgi:GMP reductase